MNKVVVVNKHGNKISSYTVIVGNKKMELSKEQLAELIELEGVENAKKQVYGGKVIIRITPGTVKENRVTSSETSKKADTASKAKGNSKKDSNDLVFKIAVNQKEVTVNDTNIVRYNHGFNTAGRYTAFVYEDVLAKSDKYFAIAVHDSNPGCYEYLDRIYVVKLRTAEIECVPIYKFLERIEHDGSSIPRKITIDGDIIIVHDLLGRARLQINAAHLFAVKKTEGDVISPKLNPKIASSWFDYEIVDGDDIIVTLKRGVDRNNLLKLQGFTPMYDTFKFAGAIFQYGQSEFYMIDSATGKSWSVSYGSSTTMTTAEVWKMRDKLLEFIKYEVPTYSKLGIKGAVVARKGGDAR